MSGLILCQILSSQILFFVLKVEKELSSPALQVGAYISQPYFTLRTLPRCHLARHMMTIQLVYSNNVVTSIIVTGSAKT